MEQFYKIEKDRLHSIIARYRAEDKSGILSDLEAELIGSSTHEVATYGELEYLKEKRRFLVSKAMGKISDVELELLEQITDQLRNFELSK